MTIPDKDKQGKYDVFDVQDIRDYKRAKARLKELQDQYDNVGMDLSEAEALSITIQAQKSRIDSFKSRICDVNSTYMSKNIDALYKSVGIRMTDVDELVGVSTGYVAKGIAPDSGRRLSVDIVLRLSRLFNINMDDLLNTNISAPTKDLKQAVDFIIKLKSDTEEGIIHWNQYTRDYKYTEIDNLLFSIDDNEKYIYAPNGEDTYWTPYGRMYMAETKIGTILLIQVADNASDKSTNIQYELYIFEETEPDNYGNGYSVLLTKLCYSDDDITGLLRAKMESLYNEVVTHEKDFFITDDAKKYMDFFMKKAEDEIISSVEDDDDDSLPF